MSEPRAAPSASEEDKARARAILAALFKYEPTADGIGCVAAEFARIRAEATAAEKEAVAAWLAHRAKEIRDGDLLPISSDGELDGFRCRHPLSRGRGCK